MFERVAQVPFFPESYQFQNPSIEAKKSIATPLDGTLFRFPQQFTSTTLAFLGGEREKVVSCPRIQYSDLGNGSIPDRSVRSPTH